MILPLANLDFQTLLLNQRGSKASNSVGNNGKVAAK